MTKQLLLLTANYLTATKKYKTTHDSQNLWYL